MLRALKIGSATRHTACLSLWSVEHLSVFLGTLTLSQVLEYSFDRTIVLHRARSQWGRPFPQLVLVLLYPTDYQKSRLDSSQA